MILRRGATPAVLRLYDETESDRNFEHGDTNVLIVLDEADPDILAGNAQGRRRGVLDRGRSAIRSTTTWSSGGWGTATTSPRLAPLWRGGIVVDTAEVVGSVVGAARPLR